MTRGICLGACVLSAWGSMAVADYQQAAQSRGRIARIQQVRDNLYFIPGGDIIARARDANTPVTGGNVAVFVTDGGVVVVDTMLAGMGQQILDEIRSVTAKPVTTIINTHTHFDHAGSNVEFPASVLFVAHEKTREYMSRETCEPVVTCDRFKGQNAKFLPRRTFKDAMTLFDGEDRIDLYHFGGGHTGGDAFVVFPAMRAMHSGDIFGNKWVPYIFPDHGGSGTAYPQTLAKAAAGIKNVETIITGHGPKPMRWSDLEEYVDYTSDFVKFVQESVRLRRTVDEAAAAYRLPERFKEYFVPEARLKDEIQDIYNELKSAGHE